MTDDEPLVMLGALLSWIILVWAPECLTCYLTGKCNHDLTMIVRDDIKINASKYVHLIITVVKLINVIESAFKHPSYRSRMLLHCFVIHIVIKPQW